jgi:hypothetical protein
MYNVGQVRYQMIIDIGDGVERDFIKLAEAVKMIPAGRRNTFSTYVGIGKIPSIKYGSSRMVEYAEIENFNTVKRIVTTGY